MLPPPPAPSPRPSFVAAGWFPDPGGAAGLRYWDGRAWTPYTAPSPEQHVVVDHPTLGFAAAVWAVALTFVSLAGSRVILGWLGALNLPIVAYAIIAGVLGYGPMVLFCVWASRRWGSGGLRIDLGMSFGWHDAWRGPVIYVACVAAQLVVGIFVVVTRIPITSNTEGLDQLAGDRDVLIAFLITAVVAAPIVEEMMFRGVVLRGFLSRWSPGTSIAAQGMLFGTAHIDPGRGMGNIGLVAVLSAVGVVLGGAAYLLRRVGPTMIAHAIMNSVVMLLVLVINSN